MTNTLLTDLTVEEETIERARFEDRAFSIRFAKSIRKTNDGPFSLQSVDCPTMAEFVARDAKGNYKDPTLDAMWWAWRERALIDFVNQGE